MTATKRTKTSLRCLLVVLALVAAACGSSSDSSQEVVYVEDSQIFPFASLQDWVTYASQISVVEIVSEERMEPETGPESTHIGRLVTAKVERNLWTADNHRPVDEVTFIANGWLIKDGKQLPIWPHEGLRLAVGGRYVLPLFESSGEWGFLTTSSIIPLDHDRVHAEFEGTSPAARELAALTVDALEARLADTAADPLASQVDPDLTPIQRAVAISALRDGVSDMSDAEEQGVPGRVEGDLPEDLTDDEHTEIKGNG